MNTCNSNIKKIKTLVIIHYPHTLPAKQPALNSLSQNSRTHQDLMQFSPNTVRYLNWNHFVPCFLNTFTLNMCYFSRLFSQTYIKCISEFCYKMKFKNTNACHFKAIRNVEGSYFGEEITCNNSVCSGAFWMWLSSCSLLGHTEDGVETAQVQDVMLHRDWLFSAANVAVAA